MDAYFSIVRRPIFYQVKKPILEIFSNSTPWDGISYAPLQASALKYGYKLALKYNFHAPSSQKCKANLRFGSSSW